MYSRARQERLEKNKKFFFNPEGIEFGIQAIKGGITSTLLVVDEIGPLELAGEAFVNVIKLARTKKVKNCIVVIRKELLFDFLSRLDAEPLVFETTIDNRNQLPREIGSILTR